MQNINIYYLIRVIFQNVQSFYGRIVDQCGHVYVEL